MNDEFTKGYPGSVRAPAGTESMPLVREGSDEVIEGVTGFSFLHGIRAVRACLFPFEARVWLLA